MATRKRFTKTLFLRICAVGLFICLGTFAVMHSIHNQNKKKEEIAQESDDKSDVKSNENDSDAELEENKIVQVSGTEELDKNRTSLGGGNNSSFAKTGSGGPPVNPANNIATGTKLSSSSKVPRFQDSSLSNSGQSTSRIPPMKRDISKDFSQSSSEKGNNFKGSNFAGTSSPSSSSGAPSGLPPLRSNATLPGNSKAPRTDASSFSSNTNSRSQMSPSRPGTQTEKKGLPSNSSSPFPGRNNTASQGRSSLANSISNANSAFPGRQSETSNSSRPGISPPTRPGTNFAGTSGLPSRNNTSIAASKQDPFRPMDTTNSTPPSARPSTTQSPLPRQPMNTGTPGGSITSSTGRSGLPATTGTGMPSSRITGRPEARPAGVTKSSTLGRTASHGLPVNSPLPSRNAVSTSGLRSASPASSITNQSTLTSAPIRNTTRSNIARPTPGERKLEGVQFPALAVQKIAPREVQVNREATFELLVKNTGKAAADNVQVHDFVPDGTRLVETSPQATQGAGGQVTWNLGTMAPGQQTSIKMKLIPQRPGNIGSVAHVTFGAVASAQTVCTKPELSIRHEAPQTVLLGQNLVMNIFVENKGNGAAENVVLQEDVPDGLEFAGGQRELEYSIGTLAPGQSRRVQLPLKARKVGQARNVLVAHGAGKLQANDTVDIRVIAPQLTLQADGPNRKFLNRKATHTVSIGNQGSAAATNIQMAARLPRGLQYVSANNGGQYDRANHAVFWRIAKLDALKSGTFELTTSPVAVGNHEINFVAAADLNQRQETRQSLVVQQLSELFFDIDDTADAIEVGTGTTYRVRVVNQGQIPAKNVQVNVEFPSAIQPVSVQGGVRNQIRGQSVTLEPIPTMAPGQEISFVVSANALQAGEHRTVVRVRSDDREIAVSKEESTHVYSDR